MMVTMIPRQKLRLPFGAKTRKGRVRRHMMWLPHHTPLGKGVERGHTTCLPHLSQIITFNDTVEWLSVFMDDSFTYTEENATESGKLVRERQSARTHDVAGAPPPDFQRLVNKVVVGSGTVGPDAKAIGPRPAQHLSGPRGAPWCASKETHTTSRTSRQFAAQTRLSEAQVELDRRERERRNADNAPCKTGRQFESQRMELCQANQQFDQARREKSWLCEELVMRNRAFQEDRAR